METILIYFFFAVVPALLCYRIALNKNRTGFVWVAFGFVFGWLALITLVILPKSEKK